MKRDYKGDEFYPGQVVVAVDALPGSLLKNGQLYVVTSFEYHENKPNGWFWYIGVRGHHDRLRPSIFAPWFPLMEVVTFTKIAEQEPVSVN